MTQANSRMTLLETARRAGLKRSAARVRRIFLLRVVYPHLAARLYPRRAVQIYAPQNFPIPDATEGWTGTVRLLNREPFSMRTPVDWNANPTGHTLWQFRLHEWEWAYPLIQCARTERNARAELEALLQDYFKHVSPAHYTAYEPYPLSRRLVVWCAALCVLSARGGGGAFADTLAQEMDRGARMLADNIEHDLDNNHVVANALALACVGTLLGQPYVKKGFALLWEQLGLQVRADGVHVENSTMYHFLVWRDASMAVMLARAYGFEIPNDCAARLKGMCAFLDAVRYPDGSFPLLNDSVSDELAQYDGLAARRQDWARTDARNKRDDRQDALLFPQAGYGVLRAQGTHVVFDAGVLGPTYCPGHGHADTLSFTLFALGRARIVDAGTFQYQAGEWRDYFRGTAAHNTLGVDGLDSSQVSGSFRVGRMAQAKFWTEGAGEALALCGEHDGYTRLAEPVTHTRRIRLRDPGLLVIQDEIRGRGAHNFVLRFHLAPDASVILKDGKAQVRFEDDVRMEIGFLKVNGVVGVAEGWYSPTWYTKVPAKVVELKWRGEPPYGIETTILVN